MKTFLAITIAIFLAGCAGPAAVVVNADLDGAITLAKGVNDTDAIACFEALRLANTTGIVGVFGMIEQTRIVRAARGKCATVLLP